MNGQPDTPLGRGCKNVATILACIVGVLVAAVLIVGYIEITGLQSFSDTMTVPQVYPTAVK